MRGHIKHHSPSMISMLAKLATTPMAVLQKAATVILSSEMCLAEVRASIPCGMRSTAKAFGGALLDR